jgi:hypothetical protein
MDSKAEAKPRKEGVASVKPLSDLAGTMNPPLTYHIHNQLYKKTNF